MQKLFENFELKATSKASHELAYEAERLCNEIKIPFNTYLLRALKEDRTLTRDVIGYMKDKGVSSIRYFMKVFQLKLKELESKKTKDRKWLCRKCSKYTKPFTLAGMGLTCADCGKYAYGYYEVGRKIEPAIIFRVDN